MRKSRLFTLPALLALCGVAHAQLSVMVAVEPTSKKDGFLLSRAAVEGGLGKAVGQPVTLTISEDLTEVMRSTRSAGFDIYIAPAQVAASALLRGYELIGSTEPSEHYVLVARQKHASTEAVKGGKLYLPQQDSIYTYMARGMLNANGLSFKDMGKIEFARYPMAGMTAVSLGLSDATVIRRSEWDEWVKERGQQAANGKVLGTSSSVPGGFSVVIKKSLPTDVRIKAVKWLASSAGAAGLKPLSARADIAEYKSVAELGYFTPTHLPGATVVTAKQVQELVGQGVTLVDTRSEKEYKAKHIPGAIFIGYHEKSLKDVAFDASLDDFAGLSKLDPAKPVIFACNGAECWKSYKASRTALSKGFSRVYWFRGGLPEWETAGLQPAQD
jgi:rhodanese-related sulfurtransferase